MMMMELIFKPILFFHFLCIGFGGLILHLSLLLNHRLRSATLAIFPDRDRTILIRFLEYHVAGVHIIISIFVLLFLSVLAVNIFLLLLHHLRCQPIVPPIVFFTIIEQGISFYCKAIQLF